jgi:RimJ/RimL family protein N-acetyltransferase
MTDPILLDLPAAVETERLRLRVPQPGDGRVVCEAIAETRVDLRRFLGSLPWAAAEPSVEASETFSRNAQSNFLARRDLPFFIFEKGSGQFIGACGLHRVVWDTPKMEVGYWCRTSRVGQGFITEAVEAMSRYAFEHIRAVRIEAVTDEKNAASRRVAERCGFRLEGILRSERRAVDGALRNTCIYARLAAAS